MSSSLQNFRTYQLAIHFYRDIEKIRCPGHLKSQLLRAASSISLNLAEGSAKPTAPDRIRFYAIAFGSLRECQAIFDLIGHNVPTIAHQADQLGACLYRLTHPFPPG